MDLVAVGQACCFLTSAATEIGDVDTPAPAPSRVLSASGRALALLVGVGLACPLGALSKRGR